jgi:hypothetical protein
MRSICQNIQDNAMSGFMWSSVARITVIWSYVIGNVVPCDDLSIDMDKIRFSPFSTFWICDDTISVSDTTVTKKLHGKVVSFKM